MSWEIARGEQLSRRQVNDRYGGSRQSGISISATTKNILLFSDPTVGRRYGYNYDRQHTDGTYHYTGEGQQGPQSFIRGNLAVRYHVDRGMSLRLFEKSGTAATYLGEYKVDEDEAFFRALAPDRSGADREVIVFRLRPLDDAPPLQQPTTDQTWTTASAQLVNVEAINVEQYTADRSAWTSVVVRREAVLVAQYRAWLAARSEYTGSMRIRTPTGRIMIADLFNTATDELIEAKSETSRPVIRAALGQILDYGRYVPHKTMALLLPSRPDEDLIDLLLAYAVSVVWKDDADGFVRCDPEPAH